MKMTPRPAEAAASALERSAEALEEATDMRQRSRLSACHRRGKLRLAAGADAFVAGEVARRGDFGEAARGEDRAHRLALVEAVLERERARRRELRERGGREPADDVEA